jgi:hypothetical protein
MDRRTLACIVLLCGTVLVLVVALLLDRDDVPAQPPQPAKPERPAVIDVDVLVRADNARRYDDGREDPPGAVMDFHDQYTEARRPVQRVYQAVRVTPVGWWCRGPVRRTVSYPVRWVYGMCVGHD